MRMLLNAVLALVTAIGLSGSCTSADEDLLSVPPNGQETDLWCWAASGQMTMNFIRPASNVQQCDEATKRFASNTAPLNCCGNPMPNACVQGGWPEFDKYGFTNSPSHQLLSWDSLKAQIHCKRKPFAFSWRWSVGGTTVGQSGHMMVAIGFQTIDGVAHVVVNDPAWSDDPSSTGPGYTETISYDRYVGGGAFNHTHWDDFYDIAYVGSPQ